MATDKKYDAAGVSKKDGEFKVRYCNNADARAKVLVKNGHTDIQLLQFDEADTKLELIQLLMQHSFASEEANAAVREEAEKFGFILEKVS